MTTKTTKTNARATKTNATTNDVVIENDASNDDTTTNVARSTTRAIRDVDTSKTMFINVETTHAKIVKMSSGNMRIDHANCEHATSGNDGKRDRSKCRARIERFIRDNANNETNA